MIGIFTLVFWSSISPYFSVRFDLVVCYLTLLVMKIKTFCFIIGMGLHLGLLCG